MNENDLINKLMVSKKIMEKHSSMPRNINSQNSPESPISETLKVPNASYNVPQELLQETKVPTKMSSNEPPSRDRILSSKLPDEIKKLMIEHPIAKPTHNGPSISNELVEKASRLMNSDASGKQIGSTIKQKNIQESFSNAPQTNTGELKSIIRETMKEILAENGLLIESTNKTGEIFSFRVGKHIFEGKVTKIKKVQ